MKNLRKILRGARLAKGVVNFIPRKSKTCKKVSKAKQILQLVIFIILLFMFLKALAS